MDPMDVATTPLTFWQFTAFHALKRLAGCSRDLCEPASIASEADLFDSCEQLDEIFHSNFFRTERERCPLESMVSWRAFVAKDTPGDHREIAYGYERFGYEGAQKQEGVYYTPSSVARTV